MGFLNLRGVFDGLHRFIDLSFEVFSRNFDCLEMSSAYWCYQCRCSVRLAPGEQIVCPTCNEGFLEEINGPDRSGAVDRERERERQFSPTHHLLGTISTLLGHIEGRGDSREMDVRRRSSRYGRERMPFNPMIILRGPGSNSNGEENGSIEVYFDNGSGIGLRRLPAHLTDYFMGPGLDRLIEQLTQNDGGHCGPPPASRSAVEAMPTIEIVQKHLGNDLHCAVCKDPFEIGCQAREMPCNHIYHSDCILPWLSQHNSCPVCRHEMPTEDPEYDRARARADHGGGGGGDELAVGLTIWRLPGGGFAVGRFSGGRHGIARHGSPMNTHGNGVISPDTGSRSDNSSRRENGPRRSSDGENNQGRRNPFSFLWPFRSSNSNSESQTAQENITSSSSSDHNNSRRRVGWPFEDGSGPSGWFN